MCIFFKERTIGLPKSLPWDTNAEDSSSEGSEDEESKQKSMLLDYTPRTIFTREAKEALKLRQKKDLYRMVVLSIPNFSIFIITYKLFILSVDC